ncbi:glycosyltransferase family 4 protein [Metaclostridioides mangenotii]|uniref:Glycosyltransferase involved in cell wall biosynthesis n=1 Tax=Metaclostridioides mangenotii TaxID=1540 RepID=A0ABS4ED29_9FIRM|nr:glycosyltransferase family 4 protein [Clostridioides mangenotii]MBP1855854.1 glycosyltransferase involved in cell wall biosynthesis [Clostridioides mangenotii]
MNILHIITQKPNSTGSGVYLSGIVNEFEKMGYKQAVIAGIDVDDNKNCFDENIDFYPVIFNRYPLNFSVVGMSDSMPYKSTRYRDLDRLQVETVKSEFKKNIDIAIERLKPDIVICHHLYLLTSFVRSLIKDIKVVSICHGTCLRQFKTIDFEREMILEGIRGLDLIFALHDEQKSDIINTFSVDENKVIVIGSGYNDKIFYDKNFLTHNEKINISYAGKICESKGLKSLINSLDLLNYPEDFIEINFAGIGSDAKTYNEILDMAIKCKYKVNFVGKLNQYDLAELFNRSQLFILPSFYEGLPIVVLEALACGDDVILTNIFGVKEWLGDTINNTKKIDYVELPAMVGQGIPKKDEVLDFEKRLAKCISSRIDLISHRDKKDEFSMRDKTWDALAVRIEKILDGLII